MTNDGAMRHIKMHRKVVWGVWVNPSSNTVRNPVRLVEKYISLSLVVASKIKIVYLSSLEKSTPSQWYGEQIVDINAIRKVIVSVLKETKLKGVYTNHSLRCYGTTRLFQNGVERKLGK